MKWYLFFVLSTASISIEACNCDQIQSHGVVDVEDEEAFELYGSFCDSAKSGDLEKAKTYYEALRQTYRYFPILEDCDDGSFTLRGMDPTVIGESLRRKYAERMVEIGVIESEKDVILEGQILHVYPFGCKKKVLHKGNDEDWCKGNCDSLAVGLGLACSQLRVPFCVSTCLLSVETLRRTCQYCCQGETFWQRCLWPLQDYRPRCDCPSDTWW